MPEKQKESKIMSMLEKSGMIRKVESGDTVDAVSGADFNPDIRPLFDRPDSDESAKVKSAPRQPVPGTTTPTYPPESTLMPSQPLDMSGFGPDSSAQMVPQAAPPQPVVLSSAVSSGSATQPTPGPSSSYSEPSSRQPTPFGGLGLFRGGEGTAGAGSSEASSREVEAKPENYTDRYLNVNELYDALALRSKKTDSIYLIEEYLQTLPDSLPDAKRREIVSKLLESSGFDFDLLMGDGVLRVKMLKEYAERFARHTDDYIAARQAEIDELEQQMQLARRLIENRKELHKKQFFTIEGEAQRLKEILTFISG